MTTQQQTASHVIVSYDRTTKTIASVTPTNDPTVPVSNAETNYTVFGWDRWFGIRRAVEKKVKR